jgi:hypothetical protein
LLRGSGDAKRQEHSAKSKKHNLILYEFALPQSDPLPAGERSTNFETRDPKFETISNGQKPESSKQAFETRKLLTNRLGYGNGDRTWYPTLFGWEIG